MSQERLSILWLKIRNNFLASILLGLGIFFLLIGLFLMFFPKDKEEMIIEQAGQATSSAKILVDIAGAVIRPGVYEASGEARLIEALALAGGLASNADRDWVARNLNLAIKLKDGTKIYIPRVGESRQELGGSAGKTIEGLININTATLSELDKLPGVGPVTAQKIIDNRPYSDPSELLTKKIISQKVFDQIKEKISIY